ncbi:MAG: hypothetical protein C5B58_14440 [Acidobacteria bacterium]|nr:MAG: hypothetical protein C5B58_14440 [Acidobacteriota bacterium]
MRNLSPAIWLVIAGAPVLIGVCVYLLVFDNLFPLTEYRQWIHFPTVNVGWTLEQVFSPSATHANRSLPLWLTREFYLACNGSVRCSNALLLTMLFVSWGCTVVLMGMISGWRYPVIGGLAMAGVVFSEPTLNAVSWQATCLDRAAAMFTGLALVVYLAVFRYGLLTRVVIGNTVVLFLVLCAYNSKEAAWPLVPSLVIMGLIVAQDAALRKRVTVVAATLAAPMLYAGYSIGRTLAHHLVSTTPDVHDFGGNPFTNTNRFLQYMFGLVDRPAATLTAVVILMTMGAILVVVPNPGQQRYKQWLIWAGLSFIMSLAPPAKTQFSAAFYLLVPGIFFAILIFLVVAMILEIAKTVPLRSAVYGALAVMAIFYGLAFSKRFPLYSIAASMSDGLRSTLATLAQIDPDGTKPVRLIYPQEAYFAGLFLSDEKLGWNLGEYAFGYGTGKAAAFEKNLSVAPYKDGAFEGEARDGILNVVLDGQLRIIKIVSGGGS